MDYVDAHIDKIFKEYLIRWQGQAKKSKVQKHNTSINTRINGERFDILRIIDGVEREYKDGVYTFK